MHKALRKTPIWYHNLAWMLGEMGSPQANQSQAGCPALVKKKGGCQARLQTKEKKEDGIRRARPSH